MPQPSADLETEEAKTFSQTGGVSALLPTSETEPEQGRGRSQGDQRLPALTWRAVRRFGAEGRGRSHPPPPQARQPPPPHRSLRPRSPAALEPPARLLTSRRRRRFHPGPSLCDVTMTTEPGRSVREPGAAGGRREGEEAGARQGRNRGAGRGRADV